MKENIAIAFFRQHICKICDKCYISPTPAFWC